MYRKKINEVIYKVNRIKVRKNRARIFFNKKLKDVNIDKLNKLKIKIIREISESINLLVRIPVTANRNAIVIKFLNLYLIFVRRLL